MLFPGRIKFPNFEKKTKKRDERQEMFQLIVVFPKLLYKTTTKITNLTRRRSCFFEYNTNKSNNKKRRDDPN